MNPSKKFFSSVLAVLAVVTMVAMPASALTPLSSTIESVTSLVSVDMACTNSPGPTVTLSGTILIGEFPVTIGFYQNKNKQLTLIEEATVKLGLGSPVTFAKQGFTGNPIITVQLMLNGSPYGAPLNLGRCVQGSKTTKVFSVPTDLLVSLLVAGIDCSNSPGPQITLTGTETVLDGVSMVITGTNNAKGTHTQTKTADVVSAGVSFPLDPIVVVPKQVVGGNPIISINGVVLGRCNKI